MENQLVWTMRKRSFAQPTNLDLIYEKIDHTTFTTFRIVEHGLL